MRRWLLLGLLAAGSGPFSSCSSEPGHHPAQDVWAVRIGSAAELIGGRTARGKIGDYKIWNRKVAFIIQDVGLASGYQRYGGMPIDVDIVRPQGESGQSELGSLFFGYNQRLFAPDEAQVIADGSEGGRALVRVAGHDAYFDWLASFMSSTFPMETINCELVYEYSLGPDDEALQIDVNLRSHNTNALTVDMAEAAFIMGDGLKPYFEGPGFDEGNQIGLFDAWMALGDHVSYGLLGEGPLKMVANIDNIAFGIFPSLDIPAHGQITVRRYLAVNGGGIAEIQRILRGITGASAAGVVGGTVAADPEAIRRGIRVHVLGQDGRHASLFVAASDGTFTGELMPGTYQFIAKADGFDPSAPEDVTVAAGQEVNAALVLPPSTPFSYQVTDGAGPLPARIGFIRKDSAPSNILPAMFGEESYPNGTALTLYSGTGQGSDLLPNGDYQAVASRGFEYEIDRQPLTLDGSPASVSLTVPHVVDSSGYLSGDFHVHAQYSPDSSLTPEFRVRTALAEGLGLLIMTEHDTIRDFQPVVLGITGAGKWLHAFAGSEITTYLYGHFQSWPLTEKPDQINNGGIDWFGTTAPELFAKIRASETHPVIIQVNHPRSDAIGGYFTAVGLNSQQGTIDNFDNWSDDFNTIEAFNGGCSNGEGQPLQDWFSFLNRGYRVSVSSGSDSHSVFSLVGMPRVYLRTDHDATAFAADELVANFKNQQVFVSCGPFLRFSINGQQLGALLSASGPLTVQARVEAPSWMTLTELRVIANGQVVWSKPAAEWTGGSGAVRFDGSFTLDAGSDAWYVLEVKGSGTLDPVSGDTPYAITNPIYVDADGNGVFDPSLPKFQAK